MPKVAIISSLTGGLGHYCAHLARPLSTSCTLKFITYPQADLSGIVVRSLTDSFVKRYIKWPRFDLEESNPESIVTIIDYLREQDFRVINIHVATTVKKKIEYFTTLIMYAKQKNNMKFVFTIHDVLPFDEDKKLTPLLRMFYQLADACIVGNEWEREKLQKIFGIPASKITIIHHGIYNLLDTKYYSKETARNYLDIPEEKKIILFFGWLREYKGFEYLIEATKLLSEKRDDFLVYVVAGLRYIEKTTFAEYKHQLATRGVSDYFILNWNYLDSHDIEAVFKASDIVALPYIQASQSGVLMLAAGMKRPVVTTDVLYDKVWIDKKAGLIAKSKDGKDFARKLELLLDDERKTKAYGQYNYDYASEYFNWEKVAKEYAMVFKKMLS